MTVSRWPEFYSIERFGRDIQNLNFELKKNGEVVQSGNSSDMIFSVDDLIVYLSKYMTLKQEILFTQVLQQELDQ